MSLLKTALIVLLHDHLSLYLVRLIRFPVHGGAWNAEDALLRVSPAHAVSSEHLHMRVPSNTSKRAARGPRQASITAISSVAGSPNGDSNSCSSTRTCGVQLDCLAYALLCPDPPSRSLYNRGSGAPRSPEVQGACRDATGPEKRATGDVSRCSLYARPPRAHR